MKFIFLRSFERDVAGLDPIVKKKLLRVIDQIKQIGSIDELTNLKKLKGHPSAFRIRLGDHRVGLFIEDDTVEFARILHRKDIYRMFP